MYVSPEGDDDNPGTKNKPLGQIQTAIDRVRTGGKCILLAGTYRQEFVIEGTGNEQAPVILEAEGQVIINGTDIISGEWEKHEGEIYRIKWDHHTGQIFVDGMMMQVARWPNMNFPDELWSCGKWASADMGSRHMKMVDEELAATGIDWTGAQAVLNVAHQFFTWSRKVENHHAGSSTFRYQSVGDFDWQTGHHWTSGEAWEDDRYYLIGKLEALDSPGEWFYDGKQQFLYIWMPNGDDPSGHLVETRSRNYAASAENIQNISLSGMHFFATAFAFRNIQSSTIENCLFKYPSYGSIPFDKRNQSDEIDYSEGCILTGTDNVIRNCGFSFGSLDGLNIVGNGNIVENSIFHDFSWDVSLKYKPIMSINPSQDVASRGSVIRRNTVYNSGAPCIQAHGYNNIIEFNHVYSGLLSRCGGSKDGSLVYTQRRNCRGTIIRYNWVHDAIPELIPSTWGGGIGIRGDDRTRGLTVHHNVVWNIGGSGILIKGDSNLVYHNTVLNVGRPDRPEGNYVQLMTAAEKGKPQHKDLDTRLKETNAHSMIFNNVAMKIVSNWGGDPFPLDHRVFNNYSGNDHLLADPYTFDFIPSKGSPLIDAGKVVKDLTGTFSGIGPDIGAYEYGVSGWRPGADWEDKSH